MIMTWFEALSMALYASIPMAILASFAWGILSILLSPCHLASIPLIIGYLNGQEKNNVWISFKLSTYFTVGILLMMGIIGLITGLLGKMLGDVGVWVELTMGVIFIGIALLIADVIHLPSFGHNFIHLGKGKGVIGALLIGFVLGIALGPCSFAFMAPILGIVFSSFQSRMIYSLSLLTAYVVGHCLVIILAGTFSTVIENYLHWTNKTKTTLIVRRVCAVLVLLSGLYLIIKNFI
ncbi:MAG: cytochrome c biogenesis protein CcdA [Candidatus Cloacimonetes bacterium]|nr:cytochrome c biogenesis protein CcdA [Candidatus Cloacimonadota bacterium]